jgi:hypothetical protein
MDSPHRHPRGDTRGTQNPELGYEYATQPRNTSYHERLRRLVYQAVDMKHSPYFTEACEAIVKLHLQSLEDRYAD